MANFTISPKRLQIDKANTISVIAIGIAVFVAIFSLFACRALLSQRSYQSRVIAKKALAKQTLDDNLKARDDLVIHYKEFVDRPINAIGGSSTGKGDRDGDNAKIVLDALPSKYDFPALASSIEKVVSANKMTILSITGTDDEVNQQAAGSSSTTVSQPIPIPFTVSVTGNYADAQNLISTFERSIRPISLDTMSLTGSDNNLSLSISAKTYYQPERGVNITTQVVR